MVSIWAVLFVCMAAYAAHRLRVVTSITHFVVEPGRNAAAELSSQLVDSEMTRQMVFAVHAGSPERACAVADALVAALRSDEEIAWVESGPGEDVERAVFELYYPRRFAFFSDAPDQELPSLVTDSALTTRAHRLKAALAGPLGDATKTLAPGDPWLLFEERRNALTAASAPGIGLSGGHFVVRPVGREDDAATIALVFAGTVHSPFDTRHAGPLEARLEPVLRTLSDDEVSIERSALHPFAVRSERSIRADIQRTSGFSSVAVVLLLLAVFRSLGFLIAAVIPLGLGLLAGLCTVLAAWGQIHGLTLAFGATLIGVAIDYPLHVLVHLTLSREDEETTDVAARLRRSGVWTGVWLGGATTCVGFAALGAASLPGLREIGLFSASGVLVAIVATRTLLPACIRVRRGPTPFAAALRAVAGKVTLWVRGRPRMGWVLVFVAVVLIASAVPRLVWVDDVRALGGQEADLLQSDATVRQLAGTTDTSRFVVAFGDDLEEALVRNDQVAERLTAGLQANTRSLHAFLWSAALQRRNVDFLRADRGLEARHDEAFQAASFAPGVFAPFFRELAADTVSPLRFEDLEASPLARAVRAHVVSLGDEKAVLTFLAPGADTPTVEAALVGLEGVRLFDQHAFFAEVYAAFRRRTFALLAAGLAGVVGLLVIRYRSWRGVLGAFIPAWLAAAAAGSVLVLLGHPLHLLHGVGALLVLSMGVDYGVFATEASHDDEASATAGAGLFVCCASTVLSFGLLGLSEQPAMQALAAMTALGVTFSLVFGLIVPIALRARRS